MINNFIKNRIREREVHVLFLMVLAFVMPINIYLIPTTLWLIGLAWFFSRKIKKGLREILSNKDFIFLLIFMVIQLLGMIYTDSQHEGWKKIEAKIAFILLPLVIFTGKATHYKYRHYYFSSFILGCIIASIICILHSLYLARLNAAPGEWFNFAIWKNSHADQSFMQLILNGYSFLSYTEFAFMVHVNYFALYCVFSIYLAFQKIMNNIRQGKGQITIWLIAIIYLLLILFLLQSRSGFLSLAAVSIYQIVLIAKSKIATWAKVGTIALSATLISLVVFKSGRVHRTIDNITHGPEQITKDNVRIHLWHNALKISKQTPLIGVGTGDGENLVKQHYSPELFKASGERFLNLHNQYLETLVANGLVGLVILILLLLPFRNKYLDKEQILLLTVFCLTLLISLMFESMLERISGIIFFSYFYAILRCGNPKTEQL